MPQFLLVSDHGDSWNELCLFTEKQDGRRVKFADGQIENNGASTPVLFSPCLSRIFEIANISKSNLAFYRHIHESTLALMSTKLFFFGTFYDERRSRAREINFLLSKLFYRAFLIYSKMEF